MVWIVGISCFFVGSFLGFMLAALASTASRAEEQAQRQYKEHVSTK